MTCYRMWGDLDRHHIAGSCQNIIRDLMAPHRISRDFWVYLYSYSNDLWKVLMKTFLPSSLAFSVKVSMCPYGHLFYVFLSAPFLFFIRPSSSFPTRLTLRKESNFGRIWTMLMSWSCMTKWLNHDHDCDLWQACKPQSYASPKLRHNDRLTDSQGWSVKLLA